MKLVKFVTFLFLGFILFVLLALFLPLLTHRYQAYQNSQLLWEKSGAVVLHFKDDLLLLKQYKHLMRVDPYTGEIKWNIPAQFDKSYLTTNNSLFLIEWKSGNIRFINLDTGLDKSTNVLPKNFLNPGNNDLSFHEKPQCHIHHSFVYCHLPRNDNQIIKIDADTGIPGYAFRITPLVKSVYFYNDILIATTPFGNFGYNLLTGQEIYKETKNICDKIYIFRETQTSYCEKIDSNSPGKASLAQFNPRTGEGSTPFLDDFYTVIDGTSRDLILYISGNVYFYPHQDTSITSAKYPLEALKFGFAHDANRIFYFKNDNKSLWYKDLVTNENHRIFSGLPILQAAVHVGMFFDIPAIQSVELNKNLVLVSTDETQYEVKMLMLK